MTALTVHWSMVKSALAEEKARAVANAHDVRETAFLPAALELVQRPVSPTARLTAKVLLAGLAVMLLWLIFGRIDIVASASGQLAPIGDVKLVQPAQGGVVRRIFVKDGDRVVKGQPLVLLDQSLSEAEVEEARAALLTAELDAARARAVLNALDGKGFSFVAPDGTPADQAMTQAALARSEYAELSAGIASQSANRAVAGAEVAEARAQAAKLADTLPLLDEQIAANEKLLEKGYVSKLRVIEMRRQRIAAERDRQAAIETVRRANAEAASAGSSASRTYAASRAEILGRLVSAEAAAKAKREQLARSEHRNGLNRLVAPVTGTVAQLSVRTEGGVVETGRPLMMVVPEGDPLIAEVKLQSKDMAFVEKGQPVALKLDAWPFTRYGTVPGRVIALSASAVQDEKLGQVYVARIAVDRAAITKGDKQVRLIPGMSVTADIATGNRTILSYLLSPIEAAGREAARER
jgi:hemolysin D